MPREPETTQASSGALCDSAPEEPCETLDTFREFADTGVSPSDGFMEVMTYQLGAAVVSVDEGAVALSRRASDARGACCVPATADEESRYPNAERSASPLRSINAPRQGGKMPHHDPLKQFRLRHQRLKTLEAAGAEPSIEAYRTLNETLRHEVGTELVKQMPEGARDSPGDRYQSQIDIATIGFVLANTAHEVWSVRGSTTRPLIRELIEQAHDTGGVSSPFTELLSLVREIDRAMRNTERLLLEREQAERRKRDGADSGRACEDQDGPGPKR